MWRTTAILGVTLLLIVGSGMVGWTRWASAQTSEEEGCPAGQVPYAVLEPIQEGAQSSMVTERGCKPVEEAQEVMLSPIRPGDEGWEVKPVEPTEQSEVVRGPSTESVYRCVILLEPIQPGETSSKASEPVCSEGEIAEVAGYGLDSSYLIAKFYDNTNYGALLTEYYGALACSPTISYGVTSLPSNLNDRFSSGQSYSNCNLLHVYDFPNYSGPTYACGPNCPSFHALNDKVSSWRTTP